QPRAAGNREGQGGLYAGQARSDAERAAAGAGDVAQEQSRRGVQGGTAATLAEATRKAAAGGGLGDADERRALARGGDRAAAAFAAAARRRGGPGGGRLHHRRDHGGKRGLLRQGLSQPRRRHRVPLQEQRPP